MKIAVVIIVLLVMAYVWGKVLVSKLRTPSPPFEIGSWVEAREDFHHYSVIVRAGTRVYVNYMRWEDGCWMATVSLPGTGHFILPANLFTKTSHR